MLPVCVPHVLAEPVPLHRLVLTMRNVPHGIEINRLAQIMGHDSLGTTLRYVRGTQQDLQQAVESIAWA